MPAPNDTGVTAVELLFAGFGSAVAALTVAVFVTVSPAPVFTVSVNAAAAPFNRLAPVHVTVVVPVQLNGGPDVCVIDTNVVFAGKVSVSVTFVASDGPLFVTVIV